MKAWASMRLILPRLGAAAVFLFGCDGAPDLSLPEPTPLEVPAAAGAAQPFVAAGPAGLTLSWTEPAGAGHALRYASWDGRAWSAVGTVAEGEDWFVNWADFPSVVPMGGDALAAHWLQRSGPGRYSYDVLFTESTDGGRTWSEPQRPHRDGTETEHGFATLFPHGDGVGAVWLDGRHFEGGHHGAATSEMQVRFTTFTAGAPGEELVVDRRACDCCQTAVARTSRGPVVFYRDRSPGEVRDIAVSRYTGGAWSEPRLVHPDGWEINACPVNGPATDARGDDVVVAWFTAAADTPRVRVAWSRDAGDSFTAPVQVDGGDPVGRVDVLLLEDGTALVVWLERTGEDAEIRGRRVAADGRTGPPRTLAATTSGRSGGFPRMARLGSDVLLAWTDPGEPSRVRASLLRLPD